jgi:predicted nucleic acid-binding protein
MLTGIDTSYFYALAAGNPAAAEAWETRELVTSALCLCELKKGMLKGEWQAWPTALQDIAKAVEVLPVTQDAALKAGQVAHDTGMPIVDSLIVSSFAEAGCQDILTMDHHFELFPRKGMKITLLSLEAEK